MAAEQQLERSVLERKERDELRAIAQAMALDTNSRSKKAEIIDQILRAAGVEVDGDGSAAPATTRSAGRSAGRNGSVSPRAAAGSDTMNDTDSDTGTDTATE